MMTKINPGSDVLADMRENYKLVKELLDNERAERKADQVRHKEEIADLKTAYTNELNRVIEEKRVLAKKLEDFEGHEPTPAALSQDHETASGSRDSQAPKRPGDDPVSWAHLVVTGTPFQRVQAKHLLAELARENAVLYNEREKFIAEEQKRLAEDAEKKLKEEEEAEKAAKAAAAAPEEVKA